MKTKIPVLDQECHVMVLACQFVRRRDVPALLSDVSGKHGLLYQEIWNKVQSG